MQTPSSNTIHQSETTQTTSAAKIQWVAGSLQNRLRNDGLFFNVLIKHSVAFICSSLTNATVSYGSVAVPQYKVNPHDLQSVNLAHEIHTQGALALEHVR